MDNKNLLVDNNITNVTQKARKDQVRKLVSGVVSSLHHRIFCEQNEYLNHWNKMCTGR
ncbi:hypothetical protein Fmac_017005 [Flemingia macrophylla]|uniref:Uncharacterized protein n=1 Tax=Flemingia macrophylla TaxID=520843 RepID=A0ABD1M0V6_9FABA